MSSKRFWRRFWRYYKWHILFLLLIVICVGFILANVSQSYEPDLSICYVGKTYINTQTFEDNKKQIEEVLFDANKDERKVAALSAYLVDTESDLHEAFETLMDKDSFDLIISEKTAFSKYEDKSIFVTANEYVNFSNLHVETLKDDNGRVYAVSLEKCAFLENMGIFEATDLYIAAISPSDKEELTTNRKNGRNITGYILTEE